MGSTKTTLVKDLHKALRDENLTDSQIEQVDDIIVKAKEGHYHDSESELPAPKAQLIEDLQEVGLEEIAQRVEDGDYDEI